MTSAPISTVRRWLASPQFPRDDEKTRLSALANDLLILSFVVMVAVECLLYFSGIYVDGAIVASAVFYTALLPVWRLLLFRGWVRLVLCIMAGLMLGFALFSAWRLGSVRVTHIAVVLPMLFVLVIGLGRVAGVLYGAVSALALGALAYLEQTHGLTPRAVPTPVTQWATFVAITAFTLVMVIVLRRRIIEPVRDVAMSTRQELDLRSSSELALKRANEALEQRVDERTHELRSALAAARSATVAKSQFLAMMSHEIRTPLHGVVGIAELLLKSPLDEQQRRYVTSLLRAGTSLSELINDILDISKIEAGRMDLESVPVNLRQLLEELAALMQQQAGAKGIGFRLLVSPQVPVAILGDPTRLRQIWTNLLSNALKFTEAGSVTLSLSVRFAPDDSLRLFSIVKDTGIGIAADVLPHLFEPFRQADDSTTRRFGGTGLGLVISRRLAESMGGSLTVESEPGQGSTFSFEWPVTEIQAETAVFQNTVPGDLSGKPSVRVLLVDDNALNRMLALGQFKQIGFDDVKVAEDGQQALDWLARERFDVVFMDMQMPHMDGLEATRRLRAMPLQEQPVVIAMTANAYEEDRQKCMEAGMDHFLAKPVKLNALREALTYAKRSGS